MERKLKSLFEYQRFEKNEDLEAIIKETENRYNFELSDEDLFYVSAAGNPFEQNAKKDDEGKL